MPPLAAVRIAHHALAVQKLDRVEHIRLLHREEFEIVGLDGRAQPRGRGPEAVVHIDHEGHALEGVADAAGRFAPRLGRGTVDLGQKRRDHRRTGRRLHRLQHRPLGARDRLQPLADLERDLVALAVPRGLGREIDLQVALVRPTAQIVVPHQPVEVEGRRRAGMGLDRDHLRQRQHRPRRVLRHPVGGLDRRALGQVDHHSELGLVVEGQELHRHMLGVEKPHRAEGDDHRDEGGRGAPCPSSSAPAALPPHKAARAARRARHGLRHGAAPAPRSSA